jgi:hypothetical protein
MINGVEKRITNLCFANTFKPLLFFIMLKLLPIDNLIGLKISDKTDVYHKISTFITYIYYIIKKYFHKLNCFYTQPFQHFCIYKQTYITLKRMKNLIKMNFVVYLLLFIISGCSNSNSETGIDITQYNWKLISIEDGNKTIIVSEQSYVKNSSYVLSFLDKTNFSLDTSVNTARGKFTINSNNLIITEYQELSEAATNDSEQLKINNLLLERFADVVQFTYEQEILRISGNQIAFSFKEI